MRNKEQQEEAWNDLKKMWNASSQRREINIVMSKLMAELKGMSSQFELDAINLDLKLIEGAISQFELDAIKRDIKMIDNSLSQLEKDAVVLDLPFFIRTFKKFFKRRRGKKE